MFVALSYFKNFFGVWHAAACSFPTGLIATLSSIKRTVAIITVADTVQQVGDVMRRLDLVEKFQLVWSNKDKIIFSLKSDKYVASATELRDLQDGINAINGLTMSQHQSVGGASVFSLALFFFTLSTSLILPVSTPFSLGL